MPGPKESIDDAIEFGSRVSVGVLAGVHATHHVRGRLRNADGPLMTAERGEYRGPPEPEHAVPQPVPMAVDLDVATGSRPVPDEMGGRPPFWSFMRPPSRPGARTGRAG